MISEKSMPRLLGAAFLFVFVASLLSDSLLTSVAGSRGVSDILVNIAENLRLVRISNLVALVNSLGIIVLAVLLYFVFSKESQIITLVALGWWSAEAITLAISKIGALALIPLSREFVEAGAPETAYFQTLGDFLHHGVDRQGYLIHMLFFCLGGILWYYLFYRSKAIPRALSIWGVAAVSLVTIATVLALYDRDSPGAMFIVLPYAPYEPFLGLWLIVKGFKASGTVSESARKDGHYVQAGNLDRTLE
jgi:hypothetical protein